MMGVVNEILVDVLKKEFAHKQYDNSAARGSVNSRNIGIAPEYSYSPTSVAARRSPSEGTSRISLISSLAPSTMSVFGFIVRDLHMNYRFYCLSVLVGTVFSIDRVGGKIICRYQIKTEGKCRHQI